VSTAAGPEEPAPAPPYADSTPPPVLSVIFGTHPSSNVLLHDPSASGQHCRIVRYPDGRVVVDDLGSRTGTWVNGVRLPVGPPGRELHPGDVVRVGRTALRWAARRRLVAVPAPRSSPTPGG
jgi:pSer/pThr/pTyr-binding forkhead associated (FHA) protein